MAISNLITMSLDEITDLAVTFYANLLPEDDISRGSDQWKRERALALLVRDLQHLLTVVERDALPDRGLRVALDRWGAILELPRKGATIALGTNALRVRGEIGAQILVGYTLRSDAGREYQVTEFATIPALGYVDVDVASIDTGSATRLAAGDFLTFSESFTGLIVRSELVADLSGGDDAEADGPYRERILAVLRRPGLGGTAADWTRWGLEVAGVAEVFVYPNRDGLGTTDVAAFHAASGSARSLSTAERLVLEAALSARRPITMIPRVLETIVEDADVQVLVTPMPDPSLRPDWTEPAGGLTVAAWSASTRILQLSAARPPSMLPGARVVVKVGGGEAVRIESLGPGADEIKIATPIPSGWAPSGGEEVYAGGALTEAIRDAVVDWIDTLGPVAGDFGAGWKGALYRADVESVVQGIDGVLDSEPQTIAGADFVTLTPTEYLYPDDDQVGYFEAGMILVRYA